MRYLELIQETALQAPETVAVVTSEGRTMTYGELWCASESLAAWLDASAAAQAPVMVYGNKEPLMVACFLACMKSGHPYVPIDCHSVPADRVASIASQLAGKAPGVVLSPVPFPMNEDMPELIVAERPELERMAVQGAASRRSHWICGEDLAYILFTSGSTGAPKGVEVTASCFDNFCSWDRELSGEFRRGMRWLDQAPFSFDLSVFELAGALSTGGCLFSLTHATQQSMSSMMCALESSGVGVWVSTPSFAEMCLASTGFDGSMLPGLSLFLFCGETLPNEVASRLLERFPAAELLNTYGPTESTVAVTAVRITPELAALPAPLPVGAPRPGTRIRVVGEADVEVPRGHAGEIVIEGDTVARGYYGRPDLTGRAFGTARGERGAVRTYRTGDEGFIDDDGLLHYRGRLDLQVKLNGFRIELGEIEVALRSQPGISAAAVVPVERDGRISHLAAFVVPSHALDQSVFREGLAVKERLKASLPHYMIPKKIVFMDELPLTGNGKLDRKALAAAAR